MKRALVLLALLVTGWLGAGVVTAAPAAAHATLVSTEPGEGARLDDAPREVTLTFTEGISLGAGYARVLDGEQQRVDAGAAEVDGAVLTVPLRGELPDGGYLVTYRVISADSHPIAGAFSFAVGDAELLATGGEAAQDDTDPVVAALLPAARWLGFAGLALAVGLPVLAAVCWPAGWAAPRLRQAASGGALAVVVGALATFLLQGPYAAGSGIGSVGDPALLGATLGSEAGWVALVRAVLALVFLLVLRRVPRRPETPSRALLIGGGVLALGLVVATAATGHPVAGPWPGLAVLVASAHVAAMCVWLGGLAGLLLALLRPATPPIELGAALPAYSRLAFGAVGVLVVSGIVQSVREVGSPSALAATGYGQLLMAKLLLVVVILTIAGVSRVWVQQRLGIRRPRSRRMITVHAFSATTAEPGPEELSAAAERDRAQAENAAEHLPSLRRSVLLEAGLAAVVLAVTAVLVGTPPARSAVAQPVDVVLPLQGGSASASGTVQVSVDPARPGENALHVYLFDDAGRLTQPTEIRVTLTERTQEIGPLDVDLEPAGPGHFVGNGMTVPGAGTWSLTVTVRLDEFTALTAATDFPVR
ncbi:copper resistance protein CopC [Blastococcus sp. LR1]|uniref:copper resistance CopC/CopD family protein n=1 Tax=Blastococcus sp. LR1 TaxID=2877000 RepID=UPI001CC90AA0|nr:copper resistance protein CopC [Blastococcus sp. LR1]MCA0144275.1 copper resistance protein CopC [Blastococcus sp. LR1]